MLECIHIVRRSVEFRKFPTGRLKYHTLENIRSLALATDIATVMHATRSFIILAGHNVGKTKIFWAEQAFFILYWFLNYSQMKKSSK